MRTLETRSMVCCDHLEVLSALVARVLFQLERCVLLVCTRYICIFVLSEKHARAPETAHARHAAVSSVTSVSTPASASRETKHLRDG